MSLEGSAAVAVSGDFVRQGWRTRAYTDVLVAFAGNRNGRLILPLKSDSSKELHAPHGNEQAMPICIPTQSVGMRGEASFGTGMNFPRTVVRASGNLDA